MADETKQPQKASGPKKIRRIQIGFNVLAQIVLILFLTVAINSIAFKHYQRWDFSREQKYALSDKTKRFLKGIKGKMRITFFFSPNTPITADVQNLLTGKGDGWSIATSDPRTRIRRSAYFTFEKQLRLDTNAMLQFVLKHNEKYAGAKIHHRDIVGVALRRMLKQLNADQREAVVQDVMEEVNHRRDQPVGNDTVAE